MIIFDFFRPKDLYEKIRDEKFNFFDLDKFAFGMRSSNEKDIQEFENLIEGIKNGFKSKQFIIVDIDIYVNLMKLVTEYKGNLKHYLYQLIELSLILSYTNEENNECNYKIYTFSSQNENKKNIYGLIFANYDLSQKECEIFIDYTNNKLKDHVSTIEDKNKELGLLEETNEISKKTLELMESFEEQLKHIYLEVSKNNPDKILEGFKDILKSDKIDTDKKSFIKKTIDKFEKITDKSERIKFWFELAPIMQSYLPLLYYFIK